MKFSLIGTGFIMPRHAEAINAVGGEIRDVVNTTRGEDTWKEMIRTTDADCIVILTPNDLHFPMAVVAADAGKIVLCEKPLAIRSADAETLSKKQNVFTVLQLHHHPLVKKLKDKIKENERYDVEMDISVYRDPKYHATWKGQVARSGGVLFNLGIHYFDLLVYLFGEPHKFQTNSLTEKTAKGTIEDERYTCRWRVSTDEQRDNQRRVFRINGVDYNFSTKDNLSHENLHRHVYEDLLKGRGVAPREAFRSIRLVEKLYQSYHPA